MSTTPEAPKPEFKVGDKVTWTHRRQSGSTLHLSTREGTITEIYPQAAKVKLRNGRTDSVRFSEMTPLGQPTALTKGFLALAEAFEKQDKAKA